MLKLRDATGRPGPAGWELQAYAEARDDYPVSGVSWYEAAAYAEFTGKSLPTLHHWYKAAGHAVPRIPLIKEVFERLDRYMGPVRTSL